jgi:uncharacterized delta-60 repeat protein
MKKVLLLFVLMAFLAQAHSQAGALDPTFAGKGWVYTNLADPNAFSERITDVLTRNDGSIIVVIERQGKTVLARYLSNGTLDNSFGTNGYSEVSNMWNATAALQGDGKIVVSGRYLDEDDHYWFSVARYNPDGSFDKSFDGDGKLTISLGDEEDPTSIAIQNDGKILIAGRTLEFDFVMARLNPDGSLDNTFDGDGKVFTDFTSQDRRANDRANAIAILDDGKIILAGSIFNSIIALNDFALARYNPDGSLDHTFDGDGKVTTDFGFFDVARSVALQSDGKILVSGSAAKPIDNVNDEFENDFALARYNPDGSLDHTFDGDGKVTTDFGFGETATSLVLNNNKIVLSGRALDDDDDLSDIALARYNPDGSLDHSFDGDGKVTTDFDMNDFSNASAVDNGRLYVAGFSKTDFNLARGLIAAYQLGGEKEICGNKFDDNGDGQIDEGCPGLPFLTIDDITVSESQRRAEITVHLSKKADKKVFVDYFTRGGTARIKVFKQEGKDYEPNSGTLSISAGKQSVSFVVKITNDATWEKDEYFKIQLQNAVNATIRKAQATVTIVDDDHVKQVAPEITGITAKENPVPEELLTKLHVTAQPNPSPTYFTLAVQGSSSSTSIIRVTDAAGRQIETKAGVAANTTLQLGHNYRPGIYYAEIIQGKERVVVRLVKQTP